IIICSLAVLAFLSTANLQAQQPRAAQNGSSGWVEAGVATVAAAFIITAGALAISNNGSSSTSHSH
ncbi:MAG: hypothetical protein WCN87_04080, partial [Chlamydiota bacterium]